MSEARTQSKQVSRTDEAAPKVVSVAVAGDHLDRLAAINDSFEELVLLASEPDTDVVPSNLLRMLCDRYKQLSTEITAQVKAEMVPERIQGAAQ